jgi:hypothetical protein
VCLGMMNFTELASVPSDRLVPLTDQLRLAVAVYLTRFKGSSREHTESTCAAILPGALNAAWTHWPRAAPTWSCTSDGCRRSAGSSLPPSPGASP